MLRTPPLQTATATIETLCGRLQSATLLEDRRAAILGLRSFAKQYPASVASGSLRELITVLRRDGLGESLNSKDKDGDANGVEEGGDVDTIRLVMETLLMLFSPDSNSPEAGDEIAFFMADEFSMVCNKSSILPHSWRTMRAKLMPAPRQHILTPESARPDFAICRLLFATVQRTDLDLDLRRQTGAIARMRAECTSWDQSCCWNTRRCQRRCEKCWIAFAGRPDRRCKRRPAEDRCFRRCVRQVVCPHPHGGWSCGRRYSWTRLPELAREPYSRLCQQPEYVISRT